MKKLSVKMDLRLLMMNILLICMIYTKRVF